MSTQCIDQPGVSAFQHPSLTRLDTNKIFPPFPHHKLVNHITKDDPLSSDIWKLYTKAQNHLPDGKRIENMIWRKMAVQLRNKEKNEASFQPQNSLTEFSQASMVIPADESDFDEEEPSQQQPPMLVYPTSLPAQQIANPVSMPQMPQFLQQYQPDPMMQQFAQPRMNEFMYQDPSAMNFQTTPQQQIEAYFPTTIPKFPILPWFNPVNSFYQYNTQPLMMNTTFQNAPVQAPPQASEPGLIPEPPFDYPINPYQPDPAFVNGVPMDQGETYPEGYYTPDPKPMKKLKRLRTPRHDQISTVASTSTNVEPSNSQSIQQAQALRILELERMIQLLLIQKDENQSEPRPLANRSQSTDIVNNNQLHNPATPPKPVRTNTNTSSNSNEQAPQQKNIVFMNPFTSNPTPPNQATQSPRVYHHFASYQSTTVPNQQDQSFSNAPINIKDKSQPTIINGNSPDPMLSANNILTDNSGSRQITCSNCKATKTPLWRRAPDTSPLCNACGLFLKLHGRTRPLSLKTNEVKRRNRSNGKNLPQSKSQAVLAKNTLDKLS
jgi:hypothetical protein